MQESNVAPPQDSIDQKPISSSLPAIGNMSSMRMRVASKLWCASRNTSSVIPSGFFSVMQIYINCFFDAA